MIIKLDRLDKEAAEVTDNDVDQVLDSMRDRLSELVSVDKPALENGDYADIDFEGSVEGVTSEGLSQKGATLEIGGGRFIPGFEEQLVGMSVGEEREISVKFPDDYHNTELAGKDAIFRVKLNDIRERRRPELDDEFAKDAGDHESLEKLKADVRERLQKDAEAHAEHEFEEKVIAEVVDRCTVDMPKILVDRAVSSMINELTTRLRYRGMDMEQYLQARQMTEQQLKDEFVPAAERQVKTDLVLDAVSEAEEVAVTDSDVDARLTELAERYSRSVDEMRQFYLNEQRMDTLRDSLRIEKTVAKLKDYASMRVVVS